MEVFSLLKFWRNAAGTDTFAGDAFSEADFSTSSYDFRNQMEEEFDDQDSFFDLVFTSPDRDTQQTKCATNTVKINDDFFRPDSKLNGDLKSNFMELPTDVFYKPKQYNSKPQSPISMLKSSPKLRVFMLGFSKPKLVKSQVSCASMAANASNQPDSSKRFTVCEVPIASLLTRDNSLRAKLTTEKLDDSSSADEPSKTNKYLNLIKPLYVKSSKRYTDKTRFSEQSPSSSPTTTVPVLSPRNQVEGSRTRVFRNVSKHLGKSRSEWRSMAGKVNPSPLKRDDSALEQQDGIQGAILHCKQSFNASAHGCYVLARSDSAPAQGKWINQPRISVEEEKRSSI